MFDEIDGIFKFMLSFWFVADKTKVCLMQLLVKIVKKK